MRDIFITNRSGRAGGAGRGGAILAAVIVSADVEM